MSEAPTLVDAGRREAAGVTVSRMFEERSRTLYGLCRMLLRDPHEAEDALQATFLAAHAALLRGAVPRDEGAWLATIARNECRGRVRQRMRGPLNTGDAALEAAPDPGPGPEERLEDPDVKKALAQLPESQREAVVLHDVFGLKAREVGTALGMSVPAVEALLFRGRRQLRLRLRPVQGALVVPVGVREALSLAIPGFGSPDAAAVVAGSAGIAGAGLLAKLAGAPAAAKVAAGVVAIATAGSVAAVETRRAEHQPGPRAEPTGLVVPAGTRSDDRGSQPSGAGAQRSSGAGPGGDMTGADGSSGQGEDGRGGFGPGAADDDAASGTGRQSERGSGEDPRNGGSADDGSGREDRSGRSTGTGSGGSHDDGAARAESDDPGSSGGSGGDGDTRTGADDPVGSGSADTSDDHQGEAVPTESGGSGETGSDSGTTSSGGSGSGSGGGSSSGSGSGSGSDPQPTGEAEPVPPA